MHFAILIISLSLSSKLLEIDLKTTNYKLGTFMKN